MQVLLLSLATAFIKWYVGSGVFGRIEVLVNQMMLSDISKEEKRAFVIAAVKEEYTLIRTRVIDMVIGLLLTRKDK